RGRVIEMNAAASRMLAGSAVLQIDNRELRSKVSSKERALRHAIRASSSAAASATIPMGRLAVEIYPLHSERWPVGLPVKSMAVLTERRTACQCEARAARGDAACPPNEPQCVDALGGCYGLTRS